VSGSALVLVVAGWLAGTVLLWRVRTPPPATGAGLADRVSVVIPARDEEENLPRLLRSLAAQVESPAEVIVVDDGSTDATAAVAAAWGATVVRAPAPPTGWLGKPWACHRGCAVASGAHLLLLDADTWLAPDGVARLVAAHAGAAPDGLLSVQPYHEVQRPYEQLSAAGHVVSVMASGMAVAGGRGSSSVAFGPCLVTTATDLDAVGGFAAVRGELVEDAALAARFRAVGRPVRIMAGGDTVRFRMYPDGLRSLLQGWARSLAAGAGRAPAASTAGAVLWVAAALAVVVAMAVGPSPAVAASYVAFAGQVMWILRRLGSFSPLAGVLFPLPLLAFVLIFVWSVASRVARRPVTWRGRHIPARP
jgi:4,4'-diaponeurosporenoate glycosyltransferase